MYIYIYIYIYTPSGTTRHLHAMKPTKIAHLFFPLRQCGQRHSVSGSILGHVMSRLRRNLKRQKIALKSPVLDRAKWLSHHCSPSSVHFPNARVAERC